MPAPSGGYALEYKRNVIILDQHIHRVTIASAIAALYATLSILLEPISYGPLQFRLSEALAVLPVVTPAAIPGLAIGCFLANLFGPNGILDVVIGTICTLVAALGTYWARRHTGLALCFPVIVNALGVSAYLHFLARVPFWYSVVSIFIGEALVVFGPGLLFLHVLRKTGLAEKYGSV